MAKRKPKPKPAGATAEWIGAEVRPSDVASKWTIGGSPLAPHVARGSRQQALICATINASACASMPLRFYTKGAAPLKRSSAYRKRMKYLTDARCVGKAAEHATYAGDAVEVESHPVKDLLHRPNPWMMGSEFLEFMFFSWEVTGNSFAFFDDAGMGALLPMLPQYTRVCPSETEFIDSYLYFRDSTDVLRILPDNMWHLKLRPSLVDPFYGLSPIQACATESDLTDAATTAEWYRWMNGGRPDYAVTLEPGALPAELAQVKAELARQVRGIRKTGAPLVLSNAKVVNLGWAPKEMEYTAGMGYSDERVQNAYGVPQSMVKLNDANLASAKTGNAQHARQTVLPRLCRFADYINEWLISRMGFEPGSIWCAFDDPVMEDEAAESTRRVALVGAGIMTLDEARAEEGLDPYGEGVGDVPRVNGRSIESIDAPPPAPMLPPPNNQNVTVEREDKEDPDETAEKVAALVMFKIAGSKIAGLVADFKSSGCKWYGTHAHIETKDDDRFRLRRPTGVPGLTQDLTDALDKWYRDAFARGLADVGIGIPANIGASDVSLNAILAEHLPKILTAAATQGAESIPNGSFDVLPENALSFLQGYQVRLATQVAGDVTDSMNDALARGLSEGLTTRQIADSLRDVMPDASQYRAERVARTESAYVMERGRLIGWQANGVEEKEWLLSGNPCALCEEIKARNPGPIPTGQPFFEGGWTDGQTAPAHPNCTCSTAAVFRVPPEEEVPNA